MVLFTSYVTPQSGTYEGERNREGKYHGQGTLTGPDGIKYVGEWKDGSLFGQGTLTWPDGKSLFKYEWKDGHQETQGTYTWPDGKKYVGEFKGFLPNGMGTYTWPDGKKYVGEYKDGHQDGQGIFTSPEDGTKYVGEWKDGSINGMGTYTWPDGKKYVGEFKDDERNGKGILFKVNGEIKSGTWTNDIFQKNWTIIALDNFLRNKYPQFKGLNYSKPNTSESSQKNKVYSTPITSVSKQRNEVYLPPPPDNPSSIAVVDFTGYNISEDECRALTDRLRTELFNTKHYKVIEREEMMNKILSEQKFQYSGCVTDVCMVELGQFVGVKKIIGGSISQIGNVFSVSARIVNVETGEIEKTGTYDHIGDIGELLMSGMKMVAYELIND